MLIGLILIEILYQVLCMANQENNSKIYKKNSAKQAER